MSGHMWKLLTDRIALEVTNESARHAEYLSWAEATSYITYMS
jgi:hypothetical protein